VILFSTSGIGEPLQRVNASGGFCTALAKPEDGSNNRYPEFLPDGKYFVYVNNGRDEAKHGLYLSSLDNRTPRRLLADVSSALFVPSATGKKYGYENIRALARIAGIHERRLEAIKGGQR
jgi:hypothetical protein